MFFEFSVKELHIIYATECGLTVNHWIKKRHLHVENGIIYRRNQYYGNT